MSYTGKGLFTQATTALSSTFTALAESNSGAVTMQSLKNAISKKTDDTSLNTSFISYLSTNFSSIDQNGDGTIDEKDMNNFLDTMSRKGMTYEEIATLCATNGSNSLVNTVLTYFDEIDKNGDGRVTSEEITAFSMEEERDKLQDEFGKFKPTSMSIFYEADSSADDWTSVMSKANRNSMGNNS
ncbi:EF-hand domain-containing protein [bacterium]|nr:EF-hand domain-containing protein [bacterium]